jgi:hypothetical protein
MLSRRNAKSHAIYLLLFETPALSLSLSKNPPLSNVRRNKQQPPAPEIPQNRPGIALYLEFLQIPIPIVNKAATSYSGFGRIRAA